MAARRSLLLALPVSVVALVVALLVLEVVARVLPLWVDDLSDFDPGLGFAHVPGAEGWWVNVAFPFEFRSYVRINSHGLHDHEFPADKPAGRTRILLLGDSFVDALEVSLDDAFAKQLERLFRDSGASVDVINGGHYGYGTDQELLFYRLRGRSFAPDVVVLCFVPRTDLDDNVRTGPFAVKPFFELRADGTLDLKDFPLSTPRVLPADSLLARIKRVLYTHSKLYRFTGFHIKRRLPDVRALLERAGLMNQTVTLPLETSAEDLYREPTSNHYERAWALTRALILRLREEVEHDGAAFFLAVVPEPGQFVPRTDAAGFDAATWSRRTMHLCEDEGLRCLDLYPPFRALTADTHQPPLFYPRDGHPTPAGHRRIAEALHGFLAQARELRVVQ